MEEVTDTSFKEYVKRNPKTVAYFYGIRCPKCRSVSEILEELSKEENDGVNFIKISDVEAPDSFRRMGIMSTPTVVLFVNGQEKARLDGFVTKQKLGGLINSV